MSSYIFFYNPLILPLCVEMMFLANENVAGDWLAVSLETREIFDLPFVVNFAAAFFVPLAENCRQAA